jgi:hypothetical protein
MIITFAIVWAVGGVYEKDEREQFHQFLEEKGYPLPRKGRENETVFDYFLELGSNNSLKWELCVPVEW